MIIKEELKVRVKYNVKINSQGEKVKYPYYIVTFPIEYSNRLKERKILKNVTIVTDEEKIELSNVKIFSLEYYRKGEEKIPYFSISIPKEIGEKLIADFLPALEGRGFPSSIWVYISHLRGSREGQRPPPI
uniref:Hypothetical plasmid protein n=1 Tax=Saccharolobus solfataricus (strain ATCC 35092 / DSM 1617 / JCM 11322 / P2) TaxID=273057 RepID=S6DG80_SACS2|nr:hypothetical protein [Saccharolobus solfataricus]CDF66436.1 hypothetical plasmid protein [Saccharolobus solfataricus P2]